MSKLDDILDKGFTSVKMLKAILKSGGLNVKERYDLNDFITSIEKAEKNVNKVVNKNIKVNNYFIGPSLQKNYSINYDCECLVCNKNFNTSCIGNSKSCGCLSKPKYSFVKEDLDACKVNSELMAKFAKLQLRSTEFGRENELF